MPTLQLSSISHIPLVIYHFVIRMAEGNDK
jgi:hypothetical protein